MLAPGSLIKVRKLRPDGSLSYTWEGGVLRCDDTGIVLRAEFNVDVRELGFTTLRRGDVFVEFYYWDRWYNIFQISEPDGTLKGWYANIGRPAQLEADRPELSYVDLELDVWANADGSYVVLDEEEFAGLLAVEPALREPAQRGRAELLALVEQGLLPHWTD